METHCEDTEDVGDYVRVPGDFQSKSVLYPCGSLANVCSTSPIVQLDALSFPKALLVLLLH